jgi:hypothetical protein
MLGLKKQKFQKSFTVKYVGEEKFYRAEIAGLNQHKRSSWRGKSKANNDYLV